MPPSEVKMPPSNCIMPPSSQNAAAAALRAHDDASEIRKPFSAVRMSLPGVMTNLLQAALR